MPGDLAGACVATAPSRTATGCVLAEIRSFISVIAEVGTPTLLYISAKQRQSDRAKKLLLRLEASDYLVRNLPGQPERVRWDRVNGHRSTK